MKWRTGSEVRISCLKRDYGWRRSPTDGLAGAQTWCAWGVLAHKATKISGLIEAKDATVGAGSPNAEPTGPTRHRPAGQSPDRGHLTSSRLTLHPTRPGRPGTGRTGRSE